MFRDLLFDHEYGHVRQMMDKVQAGEYVYSSDLNSHKGSLSNYIASTTAVLYLMYRKGGSSYVQYMLVDFLFSGDRDLAANGGRDAGFQNAWNLAHARWLLLRPQRLSQRGQRERSGVQHRTATPELAVHHQPVQSHDAVLRCVRAQPQRRVRRRVPPGAQTVAIVAPCPCPERGPLSLPRVAWRRLVAVGRLLPDGIRVECVPLTPETNVRSVPGNATLQHAPIFRLLLKMAV